MNKILRNILAVILGWFLGSVVNMGIIYLGSILISTPEGFDNSTMERLAETIHLLKPVNYISVFLAHGLGTLIGAFIAAKIAGSRKKLFALIIGCLFLIGGIINTFILPAPMWYNIIDIALAYIPMAWVGWKLSGGE